VGQFVRGVAGWLGGQHQANRQILEPGTGSLGYDDSVSAPASSESRRLGYYAQFLDDERLSPEERAQIARHLNVLLGANCGDPDEARRRFLPFVHQVWPRFIEGRHHHIMAEVFERVERGELKRVIVNLPPRSTKSKFASVLFPAWFRGKHPDAKVMEASHTASLSLDFGRELRNLINSEEYRRIFSVTLAADARAAWRWNTNAGGQYFAVGKSGAAAGRGGDLIIIDDPHSEQAVIENSKEEFKKTWAWYLAGPRQRLQPGGSIVVVMTRWGELDLTGQLLKQAIEDEEGEQWELIESPAILPSGESLFPGFWPIEELRCTKATLRLRWVGKVRDEMAAFPHGENDDLHDAAVYGLLRIRQGGLMRLSTDLEAEYQPRRAMEYY
jgi:hypothetical protein